MRRSGTSLRSITSVIQDTERRTRRNITEDEAVLTEATSFDYSRNMDTNKAIDALGALAQRSRLAIFKLLVEAGPDGLPAGVIGERLDLPPATLSFHLAHLARAGLLKQQQAGRFVIYSTNFETMNELVDYLTENCCAGAACTTPVRKSAKCTPVVSQRRRPTEKA